MTVVLNTLIALPVYALMRRALLPVPARRPAPPPAPGLHDGRSQPDLPRLADAADASKNALRPITPQLAWRVAVLGGIAFVLFGIVFFRLWYLQVLTRRGGARHRRRARTACARSASRRRAATSSTATTSRSCRTKRPRSSSSSRPAAREVREDADDYRKDARRGRERAPEAQASYDAFRRQLKRRRAQGRPRPRSASSSALRKQAHGGAQGRDPAVRPARARR